MRKEYGIILDIIDGIVNVLKCFKEFFSYPIPLGIDLLVVIIVTILFYQLQDNRRKDYVANQKHSSATNKMLQKTIKDKEKTIRNRERRIYKLEERLDSFGLTDKRGE